MKLCLASKTRQQANRHRQAQAKTGRHRQAHRHAGTLVSSTTLNPQRLFSPFGIVHYVKYSPTKNYPGHPQYRSWVALASSPRTERGSYQ